MKPSAAEAADKGARPRKRRVAGGAGGEQPRSGSELGVGGVQAFPAVSGVAFSRGLVPVSPSWLSLRAPAVSLVLGLGLLPLSG